MAKKRIAIDDALYEAIEAHAASMTRTTDDCIAQALVDWVTKQKLIGSVLNALSVISNIKTLAHTPDGKPDTVYVARADETSTDASRTMFGASQ